MSPAVVIPFPRFCVCGHRESQHGWTMDGQAYPVCQACPCAQFFPHEHATVVERPIEPQSIRADVEMGWR